MWLFTRHGFFSCTCADANHSGGFEPAVKGKPYHKQAKKPDLDQMMVRARLKQHLVNLQEACADLSISASVIAESPDRAMLFGEIAVAEIVESKTNDYRFRILLPQPAFAVLVSWLVSDIDYCNFKNAVFEQEGASDYEHALHRIWSVHHGLQYPSKVHGPADLTGFGDDNDGGELVEAGHGG